MEKRVLALMLFVFLIFLNLILVYAEEPKDRESCSEPGAINGAFVCDGSNWVECREDRENNLVSLPPDNNLGRCNTKIPGCSSFYEAVTCTKNPSGTWYWDPKPHCFSNAKSLADMKMIKNGEKRRVEKRYSCDGSEYSPIYPDDWCKICSEKGIVDGGLYCEPGVDKPLDKPLLSLVPPSSRLKGRCLGGRCVFRGYKEIPCWDGTSDVINCAECTIGQKDKRAWSPLPEGTECAWKVYKSGKKIIYKPIKACSGGGEKRRMGSSECHGCYLGPLQIYKEEKNFGTEKEARDAFNEWIKANLPPLLQEKLGMLSKCLIERLIERIEDCEEKEAISEYLKKNQSPPDRLKVRINYRLTHNEEVKKTYGFEVWLSLTFPW